jgi:hypothetical protein
MRPSTVQSARLLAGILAFSSLVIGCAGSAHSTAENVGSGGSSPSGGGAGRADSGGLAGGVNAGGASGRGGASNAGGASGRGGASNAGGAGGKGGASNAGGASGAPGHCVSGGACKCDALTGVTQCTASGASCVCPPAEACQEKAGTKCFEPCGGEPFGTWLLETPCYAAFPYSDGVCNRFTEATPNNVDVRLRILEDGVFEVGGIEDWTTTTKMSLACASLFTTESCSNAKYAPNLLLFSPLPPGTCTANACGVCDCTSRGSSKSYLDHWTQVGNTLHFSTGTFPYCVQGDELWIGGSASDGSPRVSYKFKKQSCLGAPAACSSRSAANCEIGHDCLLGQCKATAGGGQAHCSTAFAQSDCSVLQGCTWNPNQCSGSASTVCDLGSCGSQAGCTWGASQEKCVGDAYCGSRALDQCNDLGCAPAYSCVLTDSDDVDCSKLKTTAACALAPGCVSHPGAPIPCTGQTQCSNQTDGSACTSLGCAYTAFCEGDNPTPCSQVPISDCVRAGCTRQE